MEFREDLGISFSMRECQGKMREFVENQEKSGKF